MRAVMADLIHAALTRVKVKATIKKINKIKNDMTGNAYTSKTCSLVELGC